VVFLSGPLGAAGYWWGGCHRTWVQGGLFVGGALRLSAEPAVDAFVRSSFGKLEVDVRVLIGGEKEKGGEKARREQETEEIMREREREGVGGVYIDSSVIEPHTSVWHTYLTRVN
jgi:hypothetical protein